MKNNIKYLVTAALPYANNYVHIGHVAGAILPPDIYVRFRKLKNDDVIFICGSDEHGTAIEMASILEKVTPQEIIDRYHFSNKKAFEDLGIRFDIFSRTSSEIHKVTASEFFLNLYNKKLLYQKTEKQLYSEKEKRFLADRFISGTCPVCGFEEARGDECENCGSNLSPLELINPRSKITGDTPVEKETTHFYIPLADYQEKLSEWLSEKKNWKANVINYCKGWLKSGLRDRAVTRDLDWGVKVPVKGNDGKVIYVWFEAPIGYISMTKEFFIGKNEPEKWKEYWSGKDSRLIHFIGKDNIVFHSIIFPSMLMAHGGFNLPYNIPANEFLNIGGRKFSKTQGNAILLRDIVQKFNPDVVRYTIASIFPENKDSEFTWEDLQAKNNNELASILGNFVNRTVVFAKSKFGNVIPEFPDSGSHMKENGILEHIKSKADAVADNIENFRFRDALSEAMDAVRSANKYFNDSEPWKLIKDDKEKCSAVINTCLEICHSLAILFEPFLPFTSDKILHILDKDTSGLKWENIGKRVLKSGTALGENSILFPQIEDSTVKELNLKYNIGIDPGNSPVNVEDTNNMNVISIEDFHKVKLRVAKVLKCEIVPGSKKLLRLKLKVGDTEKQIVSGISEHYKPEEIEGRLIIIADNLKPSKIMGIDSEGMLLAAKKGGKLKIVTVDGVIEDGAEVN